MVATTQLIEKLYREYNKKYFNDELPTCSFCIHRSFRTLGFFTCRKRYCEPRKFYKMNISVTNCYDFTENELKYILLHEMLHVFLIHKNSIVEGNVDHGKIFIKTMKEFNKKHNLEIEVEYNHIMKKSKGSSWLLWWWHNKIMG